MPLCDGEERGKKPPASSCALQKCLYLFPPTRVGFEELLSELRVSERSIFFPLQTHWGK